MAARDKNRAQPASAGVTCCPIVAGQGGNPGDYRAAAFAVNGQMIAAFEAVSEAIFHGCSARFGAAADNFASVRNLFDLGALTP
jgi:hypothetical protein